MPSRKFLSLLGSKFSFSHKDFPLYTLEIVQNTGTVKEGSQTPIKLLA